MKLVPGMLEKSVNVTNEAQAIRKWAWQSISLVDLSELIIYTQNKQINKYYIYGISLRMRSLSYFHESHA